MMVWMYGVWCMVYGGMVGYGVWCMYVWLPPSHPITADRLSLVCLLLYHTSPGHTYKICHKASMTEP